MNDPRFPIQAVARRTGLGVHLIRVWERRYKAVVPKRSETNRRLYSERHIERLGLLRDATQAGHPIRMVANLSDDELRALTGAAARGRDPKGALERAPGLVEDCLKAVDVLDTGALDDVFSRAELVLGAHGAIQFVAAPLAAALGENWRSGRFSAAHEHFCSSALRNWLASMARSNRAGAGAPRIVVATPSGQAHEIGACLFAASAANLGWRVTYLGPGLPAAEIAGAAATCGAQAVALSLVYPADDALLPAELRRLREVLPRACALMAGGRAAASYGPVLDEVGAWIARDLPDAGRILDEIRAGARR